MPPCTSTVPSCSSPSVQPGLGHCQGSRGSPSCSGHPVPALSPCQGTIPAQDPFNPAFLQLKAIPCVLSLHSLGAVPAALGNCLSPGFLQLLQGHPELSPKLLLCRLNNPSCASLSSQQSCSILCSSWDSSGLSQQLQLLPGLGQLCRWGHT